MYMRMAKGDVAPALLNLLVSAASGNGDGQLALAASCILFFISRGPCPHPRRVWHAPLSRHYSAVCNAPCRHGKLRVFWAR